MNQSPPLTWRKRLWAIALGIGITLLIPIEAIVMGGFAWFIFHQSIDAFQDTFWAFLVLGVLALAIDLCVTRTQLKQVLTEREVARAQTTQVKTRSIVGSGS